MQARVKDLITLVCLIQARHQWGDPPGPPFDSIILQLQQVPAFSGKIYITNSAYSRGTVMI